MNLQETVAQIFTVTIVIGFGYLIGRVIYNNSNSSTQSGILIRPVGVKTSFQKKMEIARKNKSAIYKKMEEEASDPRTIAFYNNPDNTFENIDTDFIEV